MSELLVGRAILEDKARAMATQIMEEWLMTTTDLLAETVGPEMAVQALRPYWHFSSV